MSITHLEIPIPAEYLPSGDHAMIVAWAMTGDLGNPIRVVLCTEDGMPITARLDQIRFEWRYDNDRQKWVDVSGISLTDEPEGDEGDDTDQESSSDGGEGVQGRVPETDRAGEGDPGEPGDQGAGRVDPGEGNAGG